MPTAATAACRIEECILGRTIHALRLRNDLLLVTILLDKGADIYELIYLPRGVDVLWKSPWGLKEPAAGVPTSFRSEAAWLESYGGGWQEIFPNGGPPCTYKGVELSFHGEASVSAWDYDAVQAGGDVCEVRLHTRLKRSPFRIQRTMRLERGQPRLAIQERITNESGEMMDYMWGHHPAYGAPFISDACRIHVGAHRLVDDGIFPGPENPLSPGQSYTWPLVARDGVEVDLSRVPSQEAVRYLDAYFEGFDSGWYAITNTALGLGIGLAWPADIFPYAWFWQEMHAQAGFPWYKSCYVMAIEPFTSIPGPGLVGVMQESGTHRTMAPGASVEASLVVVFYETTAGIARITRDGTVVLEPGS